MVQSFICSSANKNVKLGTFTPRFPGPKTKTKDCLGQQVIRFWIIQGCDFPEQQDNWQWYFLSLFHFYCYCSIHSHISPDNHQMELQC